jgi:hypothetical protein
MYILGELCGRAAGVRIPRFPGRDGAGQGTQGTPAGHVPALLPG